MLSIPKTTFAFPMALVPAPHLERGENIFFRGMQSHMKRMDKTTKRKRATKGNESMLVRNNNPIKGMILRKKGLAASQKETRTEGNN